MTDTYAGRGCTLPIIFLDPSDYFEVAAIMGLRRIPETYRARVRLLSDET